MKKLSFRRRFKVIHKFYYLTKFFELATFDSKMTILWIYRKLNVCMETQSGTAFLSFADILYYFLVKMHFLQILQKLKRQLFYGEWTQKIPIFSQGSTLKKFPEIIVLNIIALFSCI